MSENKNNSFYRKTAIILLISATTLEFFSILGFTTSVIPETLKLEKWTSYSIIILNFIGILGIIKLKVIYSCI